MKPGRYITMKSDLIILTKTHMIGIAWPSDLSVIHTIWYRLIIKLTCAIERNTYKGVGAH